MGSWKWSVVLAVATAGLCLWAVAAGTSVGSIPMVVAAALLLAVNAVCLWVLWGRRDRGGDSVTVEGVADVVTFREPALAGYRAARRCAQLILVIPGGGRLQMTRKVSASVPRTDDEARDRTELRRLLAQAVVSAIHTGVKEVPRGS